MSSEYFILFDVLRFVSNTNPVYSNEGAQRFQGVLKISDMVSLCDLLLTLPPQELFLN